MTRFHVGTYNVEMIMILFIALRPWSRELVIILFIV